MRILYVILTCEKYLNSRVAWQKDSWLKGVEYVYLDDSYGKEGYLNVATKYVDFFSRTDISVYDWLFFCDDDTFVFPERLESDLIRYSQYKPICTGFKIGTFKIEGTETYTTCFSGGAGIAINTELFYYIQEYLKEPNRIITNESDTSLAVWCKLSNDDVSFIDGSNLFRPVGPRHPSNEGFTNCITYHYCNQKDFNILKAQL